MNRRDPFLIEKLLRFQPNHVGGNLGIFSAVMNQKFNKHLQDEWDKRWDTTGKGTRMTIVGRWMTAAKKKRLKRTIQGLRSENVIEIGCGLGFLADVFLESGKKYLGIDSSANAISFCKQRGLNVVQKKMEDVSATYDLVVSDGLLEHVLHFETEAKHMMRICREYILLIQPNHQSLPGRTASYLANIFRSRVNVYEYNYRIQDFIEVFHSSGFALVENSPIFFNVFRLLLFRRKGGRSKS